MLAGVGSHAVVYQVLDDVLAADGIPAGARGAMFSVVDELRASNARVEEVRRAEQISIEIHKLEWALREGDGAGAKRVRDQLKSLSAEWINTRICNRN